MIYSPMKVPSKGISRQTEAGEAEVVEAEVVMDLNLNLNGKSRKHSERI